MRKFSAHRIYPVSSPPIPFGIVETADDGTILNVRETGGPVEEAGLEFYPGIIIPGMINAHCHLELSHLRGMIPEKTGITTFVSEVTKIRGVDPSKIFRAAEMADLAMFQNGIAGTGDISNTGITLPIKQKSKIQYHTFIELFGLDAGIANNRFQAAIKLSDEFSVTGEAHSLTPHAPYSVGSQLWKLISHEKERTRRISIHHDESWAERELLEFRSGILADSFLKAGFDLTALPDEAPDIFRLLRKYVPESQWILVHNTITNAMSVPHNLHEQVYWVLCPGSNQYIENQMPDFHGFATSGMKICLGTDSLASNRSLSILNEMKTVMDTAPGIAFETVLQWASINGACALGMEKNLGTLEIGKTPGLVNIPLFDWGHTRLMPESNPIRLI